jgi:predicted Zn-dependent protease
LPRGFEKGPWVTRSALRHRGQTRRGSPFRETRKRRTATRLSSNQELAGVFIHEAFGHICEADFLLRNEPMRKVMEIGKRFGVEALNVVDDGLHPRRARAIAPTMTRASGEIGPTLFKEGVLTGLMHSRATAQKARGKTHWECARRLLGA